MKINVSSNALLAKETIRFVFEDSARPAQAREKEFSGKYLETFLASEGTEGRHLYVGLGKRDALKAHMVRAASGKAIRQMNDIGCDNVGVDGMGLTPEQIAGIVEGAILGLYEFNDYLPQDRRKTSGIKTLTLSVDEVSKRDVSDAVRVAQVVAEATNLTRQVGNLPGNAIYPETMAEQARALTKGQESLKCRVWTPAQLAKEGFGGILAVGNGSEKAPRFIRLDYDCGKKKAPTVVVIGKAITFDSGGISIKPGAQMDEMKFDKMGGCAVLGIMQAVTRLKLPINVTGLIASAENMPSAKAYRPGDVVTTYDGQTVEVLNTDAEGRIVLADALGYARKKIQPDFMIDLATLTGACVVALGEGRSGLFCQNESIRDTLWKLGESTGDRCWPLPLGEEYDALVKSDIATVKNIGGKWGGASTAASFLKTWAGNIPWAHLDIAGTGWLTAAQPHMIKGAAGAGVRLVTAFLRDYKGK